MGLRSPRLKKFKTQSCDGKVIATVFWDAKGVNMLDLVPKRSTITGVYYANLLDKLRTTATEVNSLKVFCHIRSLTYWSNITSITLCIAKLLGLCNLRRKKTK